MGFNQKFGKTTKVVNIDNSSITTGESNFEQEYNEVFEVINTVYAPECLDTIKPLIENLISMNGNQIDEFLEKVSFSSQSLKEASQLNEAVSAKKDKKKAILEYIKAGTATVSFVNILLTITKNILGL